MAYYARRGYNRSPLSGCLLGFVVFIVIGVIVVLGVAVIFFLVLAEAADVPDSSSTPGVSHSSDPFDSSISPTEPMPAPSTGGWSGGN